jgi:hypothetical protein
MIDDSEDDLIYKEKLEVKFDFTIVCDDVFE